MKIEEMTDKQLMLIITEKLMKLKWRNKLDNGSRCCPFYEKDGKRWKAVQHFKPLTDANDTLLLIRAMKDRDVEMTVRWATGDGAGVGIGWSKYDPEHAESHNYSGPHDTFQRAVCLASVTSWIRENQNHDTE